MVRGPSPLSASLTGMALLAIWSPHRALPFCPSLTYQAVTHAASEGPCVPYCDNCPGLVLEPG